MGRPKTPIGAYGSINVRRRGRSVLAETRVRYHDGRVRQIRVAGRTAAAARHRLKERLADRPEPTGGKSLQGSSLFVDLAQLWLADLEMRDLAEGSRQNYRDNLRLHVLPASSTTRSPRSPPAGSSGSSRRSANSRFRGPNSPARC